MEPLYNTDSINTLIETALYYDNCEDEEEELDAVNIINRPIDDYNIDIYFDVALDVLERFDLETGTANDFIKAFRKEMRKNIKRIHLPWKHGCKSKKTCTDINDELYWDYDLEVIHDILGIKKPFEQWELEYINSL